jgi:hypothetical protein
VLAYLALIPGFLPVVALTVALTAVLILPLVIVGLAVALVVGPPYGAWRLATRARRHRRQEPQRGRAS